MVCSTLLRILGSIAERYDNNASAKRHESEGLTSANCPRLTSLIRLVISNSLLGPPSTTDRSSISLDSPSFFETRFSLTLHLLFLPPAPVGYGIGGIAGESSRHRALKIGNPW